MGASMCKPSLPEDKKVVIIGAGYGGAQLGIQLMKQGSEFTIIDVKDSFYHNIGSVRAVVEQDFMQKLLIPYEKTFGSHFTQGYVVSINTHMKKVVLKTGEEIQYDLLVIATGSTSFFPYKTNIDTYDHNGMLEHNRDMIKQVQESKSFVIIGGGPVGCEIAGELGTDLKGVNVTLIHPRDTLVSDKYGENFQKKLKDKLKNLGVSLVLGETVVEGLKDDGIYGPCEVVTDKGNRFQADIVFRSTGTKVNSQAYKDSLGSVVNENGSIQVNEFLQVKGHVDIFALGDCNDVKEEKLGYRAGEQMKVLKKNINALYNNGILTPYRPESASFGIGLSLGRKDSLGITAGGFILPGFMITSLKSKDLMTGRQWKELQQKVPK